MDILTSVNYATDILIYTIDSRKNNNTRELPKKHFSILLVKRDKEPFKDMWCLPGGYIKENENSFDGALRVLKKETNITDTYVEQLEVFDDVKRDPRGRTISTAYLSLIDKSKMKDVEKFEVYVKGSKEDFNIGSGPIISINNLILLTD